MGNHISFSNCLILGNSFRICFLRFISLFFFCFFVLVIIVFIHNVLKTEPVTKSKKLLVYGLTVERMTSLI